MTVASSRPTVRRIPFSAGRASAAAATKRAVNLSLTSDVLAEAKRLGLNLSQLCDAYLRDAVRRERERRWREEQAAFVAAYNAIVEAEGLPLQGWQGF
jgi:antitoxin CcdA